MKKLGVGLLIVLGLAIILFFGFRIAHAIRRWGGPPHPPPQAAVTDVELIRDWMTIPYIAHTYGVPDRFLFEALDVPEEKNRKKNLAQINARYYPEQEGFVILRVQEAILSYQGLAPLPSQPPIPPPGATRPSP